MREFSKPISAEIKDELVALIIQVYSLVPAKREVTAADFAMTDRPARIVVKEVELKWNTERLRVAMSEPSARPPFEWSYEVSSDVGESSYFKHYLVRDTDIVLAQRKVLTPLDAKEADILRADLQAALASRQS